MTVNYSWEKLKSIEVVRNIILGTICDVRLWGPSGPPPIHIRVNNVNHMVNVSDFIIGGVRLYNDNGVPTPVLVGCIWSFPVISNNVNCLLFYCLRLRFMI